MVKKTRNSLLSKFKLYYEETEVKIDPVNINNTLKSRSLDFRGFLSSKYGQFKTFLSDVVKKTKTRGGKGKKPTKKQLEIARKERDNVILGIGQLLVVVSIAYSTAVIFIGVDGLTSKILLLPQVVFATTTLIKAFSKLNK